jgi:hypothetical protein
MGLYQGREENGVGWGLTLYPDAREGSGTFRAAVDTWEGRRGVVGESRNPERSQAVAAGRAASKARRYCAANRLNRLGTLTYAGGGCHDPAELRSDLASFFRNLRTACGGAPFPYLWVPEWHKTDHGLHAHFAFGRYVKRSYMEAAWGRGFVHIKLLGDLPVGSGAIEEARKAAGYLSKYIGKDFDHEHLVGLHRYEVAQNFQPRTIKVSAPKLQDAIDLAADAMGGRPAKVSTSDEWANWSGPIAVAMSWSS